MRCRPLSLLLVPFAFVSAAPAQTTSYTLSGDSIAIYNLVGELRVQAGQGGDVTVDIRRGGSDAARLEIETGPLRGRETLRVIYPDDEISMPEWGRGWNTTLRVRDDGTFGDGGHRGSWRREGREVRISGRGRGGLEAFADLVVRVPAGKRVALYLGVGKAFLSNVAGDIRVDVAAADVSADHMRGALHIETGSGNIELTDAEGAIQLETGSGDVTATRIRATSLDLETGSGNVEITDAESPHLTVETGSGDLRASGVRGQTVTLETGSGNVDVALVAGFTTLDIEAGSGNVTVRVPATLGAEVDLETGSGDIDLGGLSMQVRRIEDDHIMGTIGDGKGRLTIETGSGNVRLVKI